LIFLYFLLSFKGERENKVDSLDQSSHLPEYTITEVKSDVISDNGEEA
jgi:hypothetical protein